MNEYSYLDKALAKDLKNLTVMEKLSVVKLESWFRDMLWEGEGRGMTKSETTSACTLALCGEIVEWERCKKLLERWCTAWS